MPYATNPDDGVQIYYEIEGSGPPLLFVHGFMCDHRWWKIDGYVDAFTDDFSVILMDARGHGASDKPDDPAAFGEKLCVQDITSVLDASGVEQAHLCGFAWGGRRVLEVGAYAPHRLRSLISMEASQSPKMVDSRREQWAKDAQRFRTEGVEWLIGSLELNGPLPPPNRDIMLASDPRVIAAAFLAFLDLSDLSEALSRRSVPSLMLAGTSVPWFESMKRDAQLIPDNTFVALEGLDHLEVGWRSDLTLPHLSAFLERVEKETAE